MHASWDDQGDMGSPLARGLDPVNNLGCDDWVIYSWPTRCGTMQLGDLQYQAGDIGWKSNSMEQTWAADPQTTIAAAHAD